MTTINQLTSDYLVEIFKANRSDVLACLQLMDSYFNARQTLELEADLAVSNPKQVGTRPEGF